MADDAGVQAVVRNSRPHQVAARLYPEAPAGVLALAAQRLTVNFLVDDLLDDEDAPDRCAAVAADLLDACGDGRQTNSSLVSAVTDLWCRTSTGRSTAWCDRWRTDLSGWLDSYAEEAADRAAGRVPRVDEYRRHRRQSSGMLIFVDLVEVGLGVDISDSVRRLSHVDDARAMTAEHMGLVNDMYSATKELASGQVHNAVHLMMYHQRRQREEALRLVNDLATECLRAFERAASALSSMEVSGHELELCLRGYRMLMRGAFDCYSVIPRYATPVPPKGGSA